MRETSYTLFTAVRYLVFLRLPCDKIIIHRKYTANVGTYVVVYVCIILNMVSFIIYMRGTGGPDEKKKTFDDCRKCS